MAFNAKRNARYSEVVQTESGAIQTDDLLLPNVKSKQVDLQKRFSTTAFIKIWGCNSGIEGWIYSDNGIVDRTDSSEDYYWRAFNELNTTKPSIAKALATFFDRSVYGATSGASIEVKHNNRWISSKNYKKSIGHWPSGNIPHRLVPDKGTYIEFKP